MPFPTALYYPQSQFPILWPQLGMELFANALLRSPSHYQKVPPWLETKHLSIAHLWLLWLFQKPRKWLTQEPFIDVCTLCLTERCTLCAVVVPHSHLPLPNATHRTALCVPNVARCPLERVLSLQTAERLAVFEHNAHPMLLCDAASSLWTRAVCTAVSAPAPLHVRFSSSALRRSRSGSFSTLWLVVRRKALEVLFSLWGVVLRRIRLELCCCVITRDDCGKQCSLCCTCLCGDNRERRKIEEMFVRTMLFLLCVSLPWQIRARWPMRLADALLWT